MRHRFESPLAEKGFTLIELLAVAAVAAMLGMLILHGLAKTRQKDRAAECLENKHRLAIAWHLYSADNQDRTANNLGINETAIAINTKRFDSWVNNVMTWTASGDSFAQSVTNLDFVANGLLGRYTGADTAAYRCPSDTYLSKEQIRAGYIQRNRSVSMNGLFGRFSTTANDPTASGINWSFPEYLQYLKQTEVKTPAKVWLTIDEQADSINDGYFMNSPDMQNWGDIPGSYHRGASALSFADGHADLHLWQSPVTVYPVTFSYPSTRPFSAGNKGLLDRDWYNQHTGYLLKRTGQPQFP